VRARPLIQNGCFFFKQKSICWVPRGPAPTIISPLVLGGLTPFFNQNLDNN
jgi:hypothetical protein